MKLKVFLLLVPAATCVLVLALIDIQRLGGSASIYLLFGASVVAGSVAAAVMARMEEAWRRSGGVISARGRIVLTLYIAAVLGLAPLSEAGPPAGISFYGLSFGFIATLYWFMLRWIKAGELPPRQVDDPVSADQPVPDEEGPTERLQRWLNVRPLRLHIFAITVVAVPFSVGAAIAEQDVLFGFVAAALVMFLLGLTSIVESLYDRFRARGNHDRTR